MPSVASGQVPSAARQDTAQATASTAPEEDADTAILADFFNLLENGQSETGSADPATMMFDKARIADTVEKRVEAWPASLPPRVALRSMIDFVMHVESLSQSFRANRAVDANVFQLMGALSEAADKVDYSVAPNWWAEMQARQIDFAEYIFPIMAQALEAGEREKAVAALAAKVDSLIAMPGRFTPSQQANMLSVAGTTYFGIPGRPQSVVDADAGFRYYERAQQAALAAGNIPVARTILTKSASAAMQVDPSGSRAQQLLDSAATLQPGDWLDSRSIFSIRMKIAEGQRDWDGLERWSAIWYAAAASDLAAANAPFWALPNTFDAQLRYLTAPLRQANAAGALDRFDSLRDMMSRDGTVPLSIIPETIGKPATAPKTAELATSVDLGVSKIMVAVPTEGYLNATGPEDMMQVAQGDGTSRNDGIGILWGSAQDENLTTQSLLDRRLPVAELGRGFATLFPNLIKAMMGQDLPPEIGEALTQGIAAKIPAFEPQFWTAFGKPIDELAGGRCSADAQPVGPPPAILLILSASLSFFPVELARAPNGRRLIDCYEFRRAPTLSAARQSAARWSDARPMATVAGIWDPGGDLGFSRASQPMIARAASRRKGLKTMTATDAASLLSPAASADILHIAAHGRLGLLDPYDSAIMITSDTAVTFRNIIEMKAPIAPLLIVLSACEAGLSTPQSGEVAHWGMASAMLSSGAGGVVGAQWQVRDDAAALIMGKFYDLVLVGNRAPASAIREAQLWLRDASASELEAFVESSRRFGDADDQRRIDSLANQIAIAASQSGGSNPYADPMLWGGFAYFGTYASD